MNTAYLLAGSNMGNRTAYLQQATKVIEEQCGSIIARSHIYETAAWGILDQPSFYNQAFAVQTSLTPEHLMQNLLHIEAMIGRKRVQKMGPRIIDLDILLVDDLVINTSLLTVPHRHLTERRFALTPLAEIAPHLIHPVAHKTIAELLAECGDRLGVERLDGV
ncbi:2-amino-4-hydroxy-6-hydroxymethyldihydropteridine diphosphokinase [Ilyomonas limi]|uniref:2-amino-4-hydroxy-6-hydroxymethyldihydropteridine pyrophosphokinase n=1 Tax=Ilyomonas limi TaxID=2575867 RepID=A0A4U3KSE5_9BACT|nr:2-amino-4-hydroxy-6-hydroxymethyldihydropteridine diphosphokinase [Ilyomonas limi]TKK65240.1 2-amino-4-hydroxy-6-hydroxymethyldihydropteridine diphosphokinase [Ilyomonas limi]